MSAEEEQPLTASTVFADTINNVVSKRELESCLHLQHEM